jgi:predicted nucleic-acid-binding protein
MICLDSNILLRYLLDDEPAQAKAARNLIRLRCSPDEPGFVPIIVFSEVVWSLKRYEKADRPLTRSVIGALLDNTSLALQHRESVEAALEAYGKGRGDFADYLIAALGRAVGALPVHTFDKRVAREPGFILEPI